MRKSLMIITAVLVAIAANASQIDQAAAAVAGTEAAFTQRFTPKGFTTSQI
jgi:hypothetical protein